MSICYVDGAVLQGIRVELELDMPGHAAAWCVGYPELCPLDKGPNSPGCGAPLDVSKNATFELVDGLVGELHDMFPVSNTKDVSCWLRFIPTALCCRSCGSISAEMKWTRDAGARHQARTRT